MLLLPLQAWLRDRAAQRLSPALASAAAPGRRRRSTRGPRRALPWGAIVGGVLGAGVALRMPVARRRPDPAAPAGAVCGCETPRSPSTGEVSELQAELGHARARRLRRSRAPAGDIRHRAGDGAPAGVAACRVRRIAAAPSCATSCARPPARLAVGARRRAGPHGAVVPSGRVVAGRRAAARARAGRRSADRSRHRRQARVHGRAVLGRRLAVGAAAPVRVPAAPASRAPPGLAR